MPVGRTTVFLNIGPRTVETTPAIAKVLVAGHVMIRADNVEIARRHPLDILGEIARPDKAAMAPVACPANLDIETAP
ncbi:MAG: hypothetical protein ACREE3_15975 [Stellaceae bacterium]